MDYYEELFGIIEKEKPSKQRYSKVKIRLCKKHKMGKIPTDIEVSMHATPAFRKKYKELLSIKPTREQSGVTVVAIMTKPAKCPHGKCIMCPGGDDSEFGDVPQTYTGKEPATRRAIRKEYDSYQQVWNRLEEYVANSKIPDKIELIVMGGTFPSMSKAYQKNFVGYAFKAMNDFSDMFFPKGRLQLKKFKEFFELPGDVKDTTRETNIKKKVKKLRGKCDFEKEQKKNEKGVVRCVGLTIETRPDYALKKHANFMLKLGCTRVELGVQTVYDDILLKIKRGHTVSDTIKSTQILKDLGFKINYHMMPGLPGVERQKEIEGFRMLFDLPDFQPDMLKIYPCMVMKGTELYKEWKKGKFRPLSTKLAAGLIAEFKRHIPSYVRVMRVQRDIPTFMTESGVDKTNLRQYVEEECEKRGVVCQCIRCREVKDVRRKSRKYDVVVTHYNASNGNEFFIEAIKDDKLLGFLRLRFPGKSIRPEIDLDSAIVRELHVYGTSVGIGKKGKVQHTGIGKKLLASAEEVAKTYYKKKIVIISAVGVREYYRKLGYRLDGPYMVKKV